jgi:hypothetical protein
MCALAALDAASLATLFISSPPHPLYARFSAALKRWAKAIKRDVCTLALAALDPRTPFIARATAAFTV